MMSLEHMRSFKEQPRGKAVWAELREVVWLAAVVGALSVTGVALAVVLGWSLSMI